MSWIPQTEFCGIFDPITRNNLESRPCPWNHPKFCTTGIRSDPHDAVGVAQPAGGLGRSLSNLGLSILHVLGKKVQGFFKGGGCEVQIGPLCRGMLNG